MKPEDIPQRAWYEAQAYADNCERRDWDDEEYLEVRTTIARAILQARSQAYEEAIKIADDMVESEDIDTEYWEGYNDGIRLLSQAIRQHSQKGRDT